MANEVRSFKIKLGVVGDGRLFPSKFGDGPWPCEVFDELLNRAEAEANVVKLAGGRRHAYRRKWAT